MRTVYDVVRIHPNKSTEILQTVLDKADVEQIVETPQFVGTWINSSRKVLRYGRGEIRISERIEHQEIVDRATIEVDGQPAYLCSIAHANELQWIIISQKYIAGYNIMRTKELWRANSFTELSGYIDKSLAYQCVLAYDTLTETNKLKSYM